MQLNITDLEAERKRREFARIEHAVRVGGALPKPEFVMHSRRDIDIKFGPIKIGLWYEPGQDIATREETVNIYTEDLERKIFALFPDKDVTKKLCDHIFAAMGKYVEDNKDAKLIRKGDTQFSG